MRILLYQKIIPLVVLTFIGLGTGYYFTANAEDKPPQGGGAPQAMPVVVSIVEPQPVQIWKEFSARLEAVEFAEIRPQVSGVITSVKFEDGAEVNKGDVLYVIDTRPFRATVDQAQAQLASAYNEDDLAQIELERAEKLIEVDAIPKRIYDERESAVKIARAQIDSAKAQLEQAKINLSYAYVKAPISGKTSRAEIKVGNLVQAGPNAPLLTSIVSTKGIFADFEVDDRTYLSQVRGKGGESAEDYEIPVKLLLDSGARAYEGFIQSFDNRIDPSSGTIRARAFFANEDQILLPGMYATIEMGSAAPKQHILIPERAISTDQNRKFVYVVNDENKVVYRQIEIGESTEGNRVVLSGLSAGEKVIIDGIIRIRPDMIVDPQIEEAVLIEEMAP